MLVILGHTNGIPSALHTIIYSFHMPLFFIISGLVFNKEKYSACSVLTFIRHKGRQYLLPYFVFSFANLVLVYLWNIVFYRTSLSLSQILSYIKGILYCYANTDHMPNCSPIWFLMCLFWASILFYLINKYAKKHATFIAVISMLISYTLYLFVDIRLPWNLPTAFMAVFFMQIGLEMQQKQFHHKYIVAFFFAVGVFSALLNNSVVGLNENTYGNLLLFLLSAILLSVALITTCRSKALSNCRCFSWLGEHTLLIIGFNYFLRDLTTEIYYLTPILRNYPLCWPTSFLLTLAASILMILIAQQVLQLFALSR